MDFERGKLEWLEFDLLQEHPSVLHGVFLRHGGTSEGAYKSLNTSDMIGDNPECVKANRELIREQMGVSHVTFARQKHGTTIVRINEDNYKSSPEADGLFTKEPNLGLAMTHADCQAAVFYDPENEVIGVVHAGWKGNVQNIYAEMVRTLQEEESTKPENLIVCISPSLGPDHAEFKNYKKEFPEDFWSYQVQPNHFNLWDIATKQLTACGVDEKNIEIEEICTYCNPKDYYSFRREKMTGRHATVAALRP